MAGRVFSITDIHGCSQTFISLVENGIQLNKEDTLFLLGDYIDRGPDSKGVIDYIIRLKNTGFNVVALRGNHEQMLLDALHDDSMFQKFDINGGDKTLLSFGISQVKQLEVQYIEFFNSLGYFATYDKFILVHAGMNFDIPDPFADQEAMMWVRRFKVPASFHDRIVVHGHTPTAIMEIQDTLLNLEKEHHINIDNGCVYGLNEFYGNLCCLQLDNLQLHVQPNIDIKPLF